MANQVADIEKCPMRLVQSLINGKWKVVLLWYIAKKTYRFNELHRELGDISIGVLTQQLKELEESGLVHRSVKEYRPLKVEYSLSSIGESFVPILEHMNEWGAWYKAYKP